MSRMSTTCPNCTLHLAVTAADLRVGQGYVRCGRCERVFNALISLSEDQPAEPADDAVATGTTTVPALIDTEFEPDNDEDEESTGAAMVAAAFDPVFMPQPRLALDDDVDVVETQSTGTFETIVLEGEGVLQTEEHVDEAEVDERLQQIAQQIVAGNDAAAAEDPEPEPEAAPAEPEACDPADGFAPPPRPDRRWVLGVVFLAAALLAQGTHHFRQSLVEVPLARAALVPLYGLFGVTLEPNWKLDAYDVRQLGGEAVPGATEQLLLRASVLNRAAHAQPLPLLRVTLQDRFGNPLATHSVEPQNYLRSDPPARIVPDQRVDAELLLADPGNKAVGFEIAACLPGAEGRLHCAGAPCASR